MGFGLALSLRLLLTGNFRRFPTLLLLWPPFPWLCRVGFLAFCCHSLIPRSLLLCCWLGVGRPLLDVPVWRIWVINCFSFLVGILRPRCWTPAFFWSHRAALDRPDCRSEVEMSHFDTLGFLAIWLFLCWLSRDVYVWLLPFWFPF